MGLNYIAIPTLQRLHRWNLEMDKLCHSTFSWACDYWFMLRSKLPMLVKGAPDLCKYCISPDIWYQLIWRMNQRLDINAPRRVFVYRVISYPLVIDIIH